jgi:hypothetical protein
MILSILNRFLINIHPNGHPEMISEQRSDNPAGTSDVEAIQRSRFWMKILKNA